MRRRVISSIVALEVYAALLACLLLPAGLRSDEAMHLLNVPISHPPIFRFLLSTTLAVPFQELFWRFFIATVVVQCSWIIWDMAAVLQREKKVALVMAWLFSAPVVLQGGSITTVVPTAVFGLFFVSLALDRHEFKSTLAPLFSLLWLVALFTSYLSILWTPILFHIFRTMRRSTRQAALFTAIPIALLACYSLTHPFAVFGILQAPGNDIAISFLQRIYGIVWVWLLSGGLLTGLGLMGVFTSDRKDLMITTALILLFTASSAKPEYAFLLLPLLIGGLFILFCHRRASVNIFILGHLISTAVLISIAHPSFHSSLSRRTVPYLRAQGIESLVLIDGPFGYDWQYESNIPIRTFSQDLAVRIEDQAGAIVCTKQTCEEDIDPEKWVRLNGAPTEVWVRR